MTTERIADHVKFAYWVPNVSGGLVTSDIEQRTDWNYEYNVKLARTAENNGFEYALSQVRYEASYGAEYQHESTSFSLALLLATQRLKVIAAPTWASRGWSATSATAAARSSCRCCARSGPTTTSTSAATSTASTISR
jgi:alkanesulfonate monooxygenase SsuD/methylene tetrahydromethanopterin reductase-like flavin-dependent oxidoreductase (luciferase family)